MSEDARQGPHVVLEFVDQDDDRITTRIDGPRDRGPERRRGDEVFSLGGLILALGQELLITMAKDTAVDRIEAELRRIFRRSPLEKSDATLELTVRVGDRKITGNASGRHSVEELVRLARTLLEREDASPSDL